MPAPWTGGHDARLFVAKLNEINDAQAARLKAASRRQIPALLRLHQAFQSFVEAIEAVSTSAYPLNILKPVPPGGPGGAANIYLLRVPPWRAYYYADPISRVYVGLLVCPDNASMEEIGRLIGEALERNT